jgi:hypothetical protein
MLSGCLNQPKSIDIFSNSSNNNYPVAVINAPEKTFFGNSIEFDAKNSYDNDGNIVSYYWDFGDGISAEGEKVKHSYDYGKDLFIDYPLIYTATLLVMDNKGATIGVSHEINVFPDRFLFFLSPGKLDLDKPSFSKDNVKASFGIINPITSHVLNYELIDSINISNCIWNATFYLKKSLFTKLTKLKIVLFDKNNHEISSDERIFRFSRSWNRKTINLNGLIEQNVEFRFIKLFFYGFSLGKSVKILYGDDKASSINFDFKD